MLIFWTYCFLICVRTYFLFLAIFCHEIPVRYILQELCMPRDRTHHTNRLRRSQSAFPTLCAARADHAGTDHGKSRKLAVGSAGDGRESEVREPRRVDRRGDSHGHGGVFQPPTTLAWLLSLACGGRRISTAGTGAGGSGGCGEAGF